MRNIQYSILLTIWCLNISYPQIKCRRYLHRPRCRHTWSTEGELLRKGTNNNCQQIRPDMTRLDQRRPNLRTYMEGPNNCQQWPIMTRYYRLDLWTGHTEAMPEDLLGKKKPTKNARNKDFPICLRFVEHSKISVG